MSAICETSQTEMSYRIQTRAIRMVVRRTSLVRLPPLIYLAGPYTKPDPVENTNRMIRIADALLDLGVVPIVPHLTMFWHLVRPRPYDEWLQYDLQVMLRCDAVLRVPGESNGADGEVRVARRLGIPVLYAETAEPNDCTAAVAAWQETPVSQ
jgi:nucleoside 2-deoxyribosyltransferase